MRRIEIHTGDRFARLVIISERPSRNGIRRFICICDCGKEHSVRLSNLRSGAVKSCGCLGDENRKLVGIKHGGASKWHRHSAYGIWCAMLRRCYNPNSINFERYGGRGITVCEKWRHDFAAFAKDMGDRPAGASIERKNNLLGYHPENCCWSNPVAQARNTRRNVILIHNGQSRCISDWAELKGVDPRTLRDRVRRYGWTVGRAIETPVRATL